MEKKFKFKHPIKVNGREINEVNYDEEEVTVELYNEACERGGTSGAIKETNDKLHVYIFWACVIAVNPEIDFTTMNQIKGIRDFMAMGDIGRNFTIRSGESDQNTSEKPSEDMPEDTIQAPQNCEGND